MVVEVDVKMVEVKMTKTVDNNQVVGNTKQKWSTTITWPTTPRWEMGEPRADLKGQKRPLRL